MKKHARRLAGSGLIFLLSVPAPTVLAFYTVIETRYTAEFEVSTSFFDIDSGVVIATDSSSDSTQGSINGPLPWGDVLSLNVNEVQVNGNWVQASVINPSLGLFHDEESMFDDSLYIVDKVLYGAGFLLQTYCQSSAECASSDSVYASTTAAFQIAAEQDFNLAGPSTIDFSFQAFFASGQNAVALALEDGEGNLLFTQSGSSTGLFSSQNLLAGNYTAIYSWTHSNEMSAYLGGTFSLDGGGDDGEAHYSVFVTPQLMSAVPIPAAAWLFATGMVTLACISWKRRRN